jgi:adenylyltransferase/sulfurtransferase
MPLKRTLKDLAADVRQAGQVGELTTDQLAEMRREQAPIVIDVREPDEWQQGILPAAYTIPRGVLERDIAKRVFQNRVDEDQPERPIVCYCGGGARSLLAADQLRKLGFQRVYSLQGGYDAWQQAEQPTETPG